ncbi:hypothetical protein SCOCK_650014 [Actinacidiphila cocklensis]|uniref:Uncharacterized protein n=1 Tax=Actinacidiphila cocklensis TaxID=887465 RepID=A0A9W4EB31_9ACTN|nr:hypothetical protein SCOCK_650014 [Actinacidiphila cocklensis]
MAAAEPGIVAKHGENLLKNHTNSGMN